MMRVQTPRPFRQVRRRSPPRHRTYRQRPQPREGQFAEAAPRLRRVRLRLHPVRGPRAFVFECFGAAASGGRFGGPACPGAALPRLRRDRRWRRRQVRRLPRRVPRSLFRQLPRQLRPKGRGDSPAPAFAVPAGWGNASTPCALFPPVPPAAAWGGGADSATATSNPFADRPAVPAGTPAGAPGTTPAFPAILAMPGTPAAGSGDSQPGTPAAGPLPSQTALQQRSEDGPELSAGLQAWNGGNNASSAAVPSGHLAGTAAASEMNVALRAEGLGAVQLHARVTGDQVGAAITVERHEAHAALAGDLPALHQALSDRQLRLETLSLRKARRIPGRASATAPADSNSRVRLRSGRGLPAARPPLFWARRKPQRPRKSPPRAPLLIPMEDLACRPEGRTKENNAWLPQQRS